MACEDRHSPEAGETPYTETEDMKADDAEGEETRAVRRKRAFYRARHRGVKEMDWLLGRFAERELDALSEAEFACFEDLLALPDDVIERWIRRGGDGGHGAASPGMTALIGRIRRAHGLEE